MCYTCSTTSHAYHGVRICYTRKDVGGPVDVFVSHTRVSIWYNSGWLSWPLVAVTRHTYHTTPYSVRQGHDDIIAMSFYSHMDILCDSRCVQQRVCRWSSNKTERRVVTLWKWKLTIITNVIKKPIRVFQLWFLISFPPDEWYYTSKEIENV